MNKLKNTNKRKLNEEQSVVLLAEVGAVSCETVAVVVADLAAVSVFI